MVRVADGAACPVVAGPLRTVGSVVLFFKVLEAFEWWCQVDSWM